MIPAAPESSLIFVAIAMCSILVLFSLASAFIFRCCKVLDMQQIPATVYEFDNGVHYGSSTSVLPSIFCYPFVLFTMYFVWSPLLKKIFRLFPALETVLNAMFRLKAKNSTQVQNIQYTLDFEEDGSKTVSRSWRPLNLTKKQLSEEKREVLSTRFTIEFEDDRMEIHHGWEPFPLEERKAEEERLLNSYLNGQSFLMQIARFGQLFPIINMLDEQSRARLSQTCKLMNAICERKEVRRFDLPITIVIYKRRGQWLARGEHRKGERILNLTAFKEKLAKKYDICVTHMEIESHLKVIPFDRLKELLHEWNVKSIRELTVEKIIGGHDIYWRREEFHLMGRIALEFQLKKLQLPNVWIRDDLVYNRLVNRNLHHDFMNMAEEMNRLVVVLLGL